VVVDSAGDTLIGGKATITTIPAATTDTDKFMVSDAGVLKYRTGDEVIADLGITGMSGTVSGTTGKIAKFTNTDAVGASVMTESGGNIATTGNFTADGVLVSLGGKSTLNELEVSPVTPTSSMINSWATSPLDNARVRVKAGSAGDIAYMDMVAHGFSGMNPTYGPDGADWLGGVVLEGLANNYMQIDQADPTKKLHFTVNNISKIIVDSTGAMINNIRPISGTVTNFGNAVYTTGILSISGSPYVQGIFNVFKDSTNPFVAGIRKSCGNHQADGWLENTTSFNVELSGNGKLDVDPEYSLVILPEVTLASSNANRVWMGKIEISAVDPVNNETGFGLVECYGTFSSAGVVGEQALALPVYSGSTIAITDAPGAICVLVNSNPSATTSSSIAIKNNFTGTAIVTYTVRVCLCDPGTIPV
jgi:hypothetical protein